MSVDRSSTDPGSDESGADQGSLDAAARGRTASPRRREGRPARSTVVIARFLDDLIPIPGTKQAIGAEAIASFVPGFGSAAGAVMSGVVIADSIRLRLPLPVIARMLFNLGIDALLGYIPWVGPVFDAWFRANRRNMRLLERALVDEQRTSRSSVIYLITSITMSVVVIVGLLTAAAFTIYFLLRWFGLFG